MSVTAGSPSAAGVLAPESAEEAAEALAEATLLGRSVRIVGGRTQQDLGYDLEADVILSTERLDRLVAWEPDDLTAVVEAGMSIEAFEETLGSSGQSAVLPERPGRGTVGGTVATGRSGWRRLRHGPTRDRVLEVTLVTGDGRVVTTGGRLVKNVTGYDIPRLATGALGSLGLIVSVCFKLWPIAARRATAVVESPEITLTTAFRPYAVLETNDRTMTYLAGTEEEVEAQAGALGGLTTDGHDWPQHPKGMTRFSVRVPPSRLRELVDQLDHHRYVAQFGVGEVEVAADEIVIDELLALRASAEAAGGSLVILSATSELAAQVDPWGTPPPTLDIQRRLIAQFDPARILNPGRLPGGL